MGRLGRPNESRKYLLEFPGAYENQLPKCPTYHFSNNDFSSPGHSFLFTLLISRQFNVMGNTISFTLRRKAGLLRLKILLTSDLEDLANDMLSSMSQGNGINNMRGIQALRSVSSMRGC
jgi:hypothetical protein